MEQKTAKIIYIRDTFEIPKEGFASKKEALEWYKNHFKIAKGKEFVGGFGFSYEFSRRSLEFDYELRPDGMFIACAAPLDPDVPFDREVSTLATQLELPKWLAPASRLIVLMGKLFDDEIPNIPFWLMAPLGNFRLLVYPERNVSLRKWRKIGELLGVLPSKPSLWETQGVMQGYGEEKWGKKEELYWQTLQAGVEAVNIRLQQGRKGKRGLLQDTAKVLTGKYGWKEWEVDSYKVSRYLKRAKQRWHIEP